jgi:peptide/nickel transport system substrate-binding protein
VSLPPYFPQHPDLAALDSPDPFVREGLIGNGPYLLDMFNVRDQIVLTANPDYDLGPQPKTETIVLRYYTRSQDLRNAIAAHEIDLAWRALLLTHYMQLEAADIEGLNFVEIPSTRVFYMYFGQVREPTDDPLVREALTALIDRDRSVNEAFAGHLDKLMSLVPAFFPDAYAPIWPDEPDYAYAETTLGAAGYRERQTSRLNINIAFSRLVYGDPYGLGVTLLARDSFSGTDFVDYGIQTEIEAGTYLDVLEEGTGSIAIYAWNPIVPHPAAYLYPILHSSTDIATNSRYASPTLDRLLEEAALTDDSVAQGALYQEVAQAAFDGHVLVPLWQDHLQVIAWDDIGGIAIEPNYFLHYDQLERE